MKQVLLFFFFLSLTTLGHTGNILDCSGTLVEKQCATGKTLQTTKKRFLLDLDNTKLYAENTAGDSASAEDKVFNLKKSTKTVGGVSYQYHGEEKIYDTDWGYSNLMTHFLQLSEDKKNLTVRYQYQSSEPKQPDCGKYDLYVTEQPFSCKVAEATAIK